MPEITEHPLVLILSLLSGIVATVSAIISWVSTVRSDRREDRKDHRDANKQLSDMEDQVRSDTANLYQKLTEQYTSMSEKDQRFLRKVTLVVRKLMVLERTVADIISELDSRWDIHSDEADSIECVYYSELNNYFYDKISSLQTQISGTMDEVDRILLNGKGE